MGDGNRFSEQVKLLNSSLESKQVRHILVSPQNQELAKTDKPEMQTLTASLWIFALYPQLATSYHLTGFRFKEKLAQRRSLDGSC